MDKNLAKIKDFGDSVTDGIEEYGKDENIPIDAYLILKQRKGKLPDSVIVLQKFCEEMAYRIFPQSTYRVFFHLLSLSRYENFIGIDIKTISENLEISESSAKRATRDLEKENIIIKIAHPTDRRRIDYFLNPMGMWRGNSLSREKTISNLKKNKIQLDMFSETKKIENKEDIDKK